jgi:hypothetical protein
MSITIPTKIPVPFGYAAGAGEITTPIPTASQIGVVNGRASLHDGFPPLTFTPLSTGGVPPFGADFNGILNEITSITQWQQAGGFFPYDSAFSSAISGYPIGAVIQAANYQGFWLNTTNGNTTNPDTGGAGWTSLVFEGLQSITVTTANVTVTQLQSAYPILVISGALTGARSLILPAVVGQWIIQNNTTGAFTLTVKTAAGTGVVATQGQSTYLYGDGTNIYFASSVGVQSFNTRTGTVTLNATDVTTALGYAPIGPNLTGAVTSVGNATLLGSFTSAQLATALTNETGSGSAVFSVSPALTGIPIAPTATAGTNTTQLATTAFVQSSGFGSGTRIAFFQATAPTGWTQVTTYNDYMLRVVNTAGGGTGGSDSPISNNKTMPAHTHTFSGAFTGSALPTHSHLFDTPIGAQSLSGGPSSCSNVVGILNGTTQAVSAGTPAGSISGTNSTVAAVTWTPKYLNMIICNKT